MTEHDLTAAHAVDALEPDETRAAEAHLASCADCRAELAELREALAGAVLPVPQDQVPAGLRARVLDALDDVPQLPAVPAGELTAVDAPGARRDDLEARRAHRDATGASGAPVPSRRARSARPRRWVQGLAAAAAAVVVAVAALSGYAALQFRGEAAQARQAASALAEVAAAPDVVAVQAQADGDGWSDSRVLVSRSLGEAVMVPSGASRAPQGSTWQLWFITGGGPRSAGVFSTDGGRPTVLDGEVGAATAVAVTLEPDGGSEAPTSTPVVVFPMSA